MMCGMRQSSANIQYLMRYDVEKTFHQYTKNIQINPLNCGTLVS